MTEVNRPSYCARCGNLVGEEDRFCGTCGMAVLSLPEEAEQVIPREDAAAQGASETPRRRKRAFLIAGFFTLTLLLVGGAVLAALLGDRLGLLGGVSSEAPNSGDPQPLASEDTPHPAFDPLISSLEERTAVPIVLPSELPEKLQNVAVDADLEGDRYGVAFFREPQSEDVKSWSRAEVYGTLQTNPQTESISNEFFEAASVETIEMAGLQTSESPEGIEATLRLMEPVQEYSGTQGPYWEGKFDRAGNTYTLIFSDPEDVSEEEVVEVLSSMVWVLDPNADEPEMIETTTPATSEEPAESEEEAQEFVVDYYEAVEEEDWSSTYSMLAGVSQEEFTEDEWVEAQETRQDNEGAPPPLESVEATIDEEFSATATVTFEDGSTTELRVLYEPQSGELGRLLTQEDVSYLRSLVEGGSPADGEALLIESTIRNHYEAIGSGDFEVAYSYFGPTFRGTTDEASWVEEEESYEITESTINSVSVEEVSEEEATATVDVSFEDNTGTPRFLITWSLVREVREEGAWKLDEVISAEELDE